MKNSNVNTATIEKVTDGEDTTIYQVEIDDQTVIDANNYQMRGITSKAKAGDNAIVVMPNNSDRIGFVIATETTEYEISLEEGEMAIHTSAENYIKMKADGTIEMKTGGLKIIGDTTTEGTMAINGTGKTLVTHAELDTALQTFIGLLNTHTHLSTIPATPTGPVVVPLVLNIASSSSQSITTD